MSDNWYDDNAKGGYIYGPLEVPKESDRPSMEEQRDMWRSDFKALALNFAELEKENAELRGIITRVSRVTDAGEAYKIERADEDRMCELVKQWEKELSK